MGEETLVVRLALRLDFSVLLLRNMDCLILGIYN